MKKIQDENFTEAVSLPPLNPPTLSNIRVAAVLSILINGETMSTVLNKIVVGLIELMVPEFSYMFIT
jgi:hypothetical protein